MKVTRPPARVLADIVRSIGVEHLVPIAPPPQEVLPRWRRTVQGLRHSRTRDAEAIHHHYDVSNTFYEWVLGPSMTHLRLLPARRRDAGGGSGQQVPAGVRQAPPQGGRPAARRRLRMGRHGALRRAPRGQDHRDNRCQPNRRPGRRDAIAAEGLSDLAEVRHGDYREIRESEFDAVSSIGLTEQTSAWPDYPAYFRFLRSKLRPGGLLLNHCITRPDNRSATAASGFIDRYVFPDGEMTGSGRIIAEAQDAGLEVLHEENLRPHYALTLREWCANLVRHWDEAVAEVGLGTARVWGLYMAGSRLGFERNVVQLHQVLAVRLDDRGGVDLPLRPWWQP